MYYYDLFTIFLCDVSDNIEERLFGRLAFIDIG